MKVLGKTKPKRKDNGQTKQDKLLEEARQLGALEREVGWWAGSRKVESRRDKTAKGGRGVKNYSSRDIRTREEKEMCRMSKLESMGMIAPNPGAMRRAEGWESEWEGLCQWQRDRAALDAAAAAQVPDSMKWARHHSQRKNHSDRRANDDAARKGGNDSGWRDDIDAYDGGPKATPSEERLRDKFIDNGLVEGRRSTRRARTSGERGERSERSELKGSGRNEPAGGGRSGRYDRNELPNRNRPSLRDKDTRNRGTQQGRKPLATATANPLLKKPAGLTQSAGDTLRWKWIHRRGKSGCSVDEELGLGR